MRDSMVFYRSFREAIRDIPPEEQLKAYNAIFDYAFDGKEFVEVGIASAVFKLVKPQIDANNKRFENGKKGAAYGILGGRPKKEKTKETPNKPQENPTETPNVNVNDNVNVNVNDIREKRKRFSPPSLDEVKEYCKERNNKVDADRFVDFYSSKGWKVGNQPMKDWKAAVRTWERRDNNNTVPAKGHFENERSYDFDEIERTLLGGIK